VTPDDRKSGDDTAAFAAPKPADAVTPASENADAHNADTREQLAHADTRRLQEERAEAEDERKAAEKREQELERQEAEAREREKQVAKAADEARQSGSGGAGKPLPKPVPVDTSDDPFADLPFGDRPEIQAGIAFGATFLFAKILKALGN
jgi:murein DD-endopeptidase MepM/ murein hydrolase activator NlpD